MSFKLLIAIIFVSVSGVHCYSLNTKDVIVISNDIVKDSYFSYRLLLQKGSPPAIIVGAPKHHDTHSSGSVYRCNIDGQPSCSKFSTSQPMQPETPNGNFFGSSLDGEDYVGGELVTCAPRALTEKEDYSYLKGFCLYLKNSSDFTSRQSTVSPFVSFTDTSCCDSDRRIYYNFGFAMAGFDVSFYVQGTKEILLGAPGVKKFSGATVSYRLTDHSSSLLPSKNNGPSILDEDAYLGYTVTTGRFEQDRKTVWFIAGAPRANNLRGKVIIYRYDIGSLEKLKIFATFQDDETGSYFGATVLAVDVTNDKIDDILIAAPMSAGKTWDEGSVYFYKALKSTSFLKRIKLTGSSKAGSRFGAAMVSLGDFDLDSFNDVAISAPYEDDGTGAVYIYRGNSGGLDNKPSQRLSPLEFSGANVVKGFGMGISRGNDIDHNGHNDIAVGAYMSDTVFVIKSKSIIDYNVLLSTSVTTIGNDTSGFQLQFCLVYTKRSEAQILPQVEFSIFIDFDYRSQDAVKNDLITADLGKLFCKNYTVGLQQSVKDISPFLIDLKTEVKTENIVAHGKKSREYQVPYSHGCGSDDICNTGLALELKSKISEIILGLDKEIDLEVLVKNDGEPAYMCEVEIEIPDSIELRNLKDCTKSNRTYTCLVDQRLTDTQTKNLVFDIKSINPNTKDIEIKVMVDSLGVNKDGYKDKGTLNIPVILESTPYIVGKSIPDSIEINKDNRNSDVEVIHQFSVGKTGPSPLKLDVNILIPVVELDGQYIFVEVKGTVGNIDVPCSQVELENYAFDPVDTPNVPLNRTVIISCYLEKTCLEYSCQGEYLYDSSQVAVFEVRTLIKSNLLVSKYKSDLNNKELIAVISSAYQKTFDERVYASSQLLIFVQSTKYIALWIYILAAVTGVILLLLVSYALYRCHFFDRNLKDKLMQEKILGLSNNELIEDEIFEDEVFRPMEIKK